MQIVLSEDERARRAGRQRADRARIILACAEGMSNADAAQALGVAVKSVSKWRRRSRTGGWLGWKMMRRGMHKSVQALEADIRARAPACSRFAGFAGDAYG